MAARASMNGDEVADCVKKVFRVQEERKREYVRLARAHTQYCSQTVTVEQYRFEVDAVTSSFSRLSREVLSLISRLRESGRHEAVTILEDIQLGEKEKLNLTVQRQMKGVEKAERKRQRKDEEEEEEDQLDGGSQKEIKLRKRLAETEETIARLLSDLRYECESELLAE